MLLSAVSNWSIDQFKPRIAWLLDVVLMVGILREVFQDWNTHLSYVANGTAVEIVILNAAAIGAYPFEILYGQAA